MLSVMYYERAASVTFFVALLLSYTLLVTLAGFFRAWVAKIFGDDTAEEQGFLSLDPRMHIDVLGAIALLLFRVGWGRRVPLNPTNIGGRWRWTKLALAFLAGVIAYLFFAIVGLIALVFVIMNVVGPQNGSSTVPFPVPPAVELLSELVFLCIFLATIDFVFDFVAFIMFFAVERDEDAIRYASYAVFLVPLAILFFYGSKIESFITYGASTVATMIISFFVRG